MVFFTQKKELSVGECGEDIAVRFLKKNGYKIIARNWFNTTGRRIGEIDIIALDKKTKEMVFVEVKTRVLNNDENIVLPQEQIVPAKLHKLQKAAECYIKENDLWNERWRFDALAVILRNRSMVEITHIKSIFF